MDTLYFVETIMKNGDKMNHRFCDFLSAISLCELYARLKTSHLPNSSTSRAWSVYDRPHPEGSVSKGVDFRCSSGIVKNDFQLTFRFYSSKIINIF